MNLVFASGMVALTGLGALMAQVAWVRQLMSVSTAVSYAQGLVLATFMAGLAIGAKIGARLSTRTASPKKHLLGFLFLAAMLCAFSPEAIHASAMLRTKGTLFFQWLAACTYLLLATTCMGLTLPLLLGVFQRPRLDILLYGVNNLGALLGTWLAGFLWIERFGLRASNLTSGACYLVAALLSIPLRSDCSHPHAKGPSLHGAKTPPRILATVFLCGWMGLFGEIFWMRLSSLIILNTVYAYTQVVAVFLVAISTASWASLWISRVTKPKIRADIVAMAFALSGALLLISTYALSHESIQPFFDPRLASGNSWFAWMLLAGIIFPPTFFSCLIFPVLLSQRPSNESEARWFGNLSALNTIGSVLGSLACGFWILPQLGLQACAWILCAVAFGGVWLVHPTSPKVIRTALAMGLSCALVLGFSLRLPEDFTEHRVPKNWRILEVREGQSSQSMVTQSPTGQLRLWINSAWVAGTGGGHAALGLIPGLYVEHPGRALGIAVGTGQTFASALRHGFSRMDCVDIDEHVIDLSRIWFANDNGHLFERPQVHAYHDDGRAFLRASLEPYDLIVLEPLQAWMQGTSQLYSQEFYREAYDKLRDGGVLAQWIPLYGQRDWDTRSMVETAMSVFPTASLWLQRIDGILILEKRASPTSLATLEARLIERGLSPDFAALHLGTPEDRQALWIASGVELSDWTYGAPILTDDRPFLEFSAARDLTRSNPRETLKTLRPHLGKLDPATASLREALLEWTMVDETDHARQEQLLTIFRKAHPSSDLIRYLDRNHVLAMAEQLESQRDEAALRALFERSLRRDPTFGEAMINFALHLAKHGEFRPALLWLDRASKIPRTQKRALTILSKLRTPP